MALSEPEELFYEESGEPAGWQAVNEFNEVLQFDTDGYLTGVWDPQGRESDVEIGRFQMSPDAPMGVVDLDASEPDQAAMIEQRLAQLEAQQPPEISATPVAVTLDTDILHARWDSDVQLLESEYGRPLLASERRALANEALAAIDRGDDGSLVHASERLAWNGQRTLDINNDTDRAEFMSRRLEEAGRAERAELHGDDNLAEDREPERTWFYDVDSDAERQAYMTRRLEGHDGVELVQHDEEESW